MLVDTVGKAIVIAIITLSASTNQASIIGKPADQGNEISSSGGTKVQDGSQTLFPSQQFINTNSSSDPNSPQSDLIALSSALVDALLQHKAQMIQAIATIFNALLGNVATSIGRIAAVFFGIPVPPPKQQKPQQRSAQSGPMPDSNQMNSDGGSRFVVPILNRPLQYGDYQMMESLVLESIDVYNKWQKKSGNSQGQYNAPTPKP